MYRQHPDVVLNEEEEKGEVYVGTSNESCYVLGGLSVSRHLKINILPQYSNTILRARLSIGPRSTHTNEGR